MLPIPSDTNELITICGIDPGSEHIGLSVLKFNVLTFQLYSIDAFTITGSKLNNSQWTMDIFNDRIARIEAHEKHLIELFNYIQPNYFSVESPFINMRRPAAYGALTEVICAIRNAVQAYDRWKAPYMVDPSSAKKCIGAKGNADKNDVRIALMKIDEINHVLIKDISLLTEHAIDAIAIAYHLYGILRDNKLPLI